MTVVVVVVVEMYLSVSNSPSGSTTMSISHSRNENEYYSVSASDIFFRVRNDLSFKFVVDLTLVPRQRGGRSSKQNNDKQVVNQSLDNVHKGKVYLGMGILWAHFNSSTPLSIAY